MSNDELDKIATPRGDGRSMTSLKPTDVNVSYNQSPPGEGSDWFGPQQPMRPIAPPEVAGRQFDYRPGFNLSTEPRAYEPIDFRTLRILADAFDPVRLILEKRKDQLCKIPWQIRVKNPDGGKQPTSSHLSSQQRGLIGDVTDFFKHPSDGLNFRSWLRMLLEDLLVLDAATLYCARDSAGTLVSLDPVDGGTIRPVIDDRGRSPNPIRWSGEPFFWNGAEVNASNYLDIGCRISGGLLYVPAYSQTLHGLPAVHFTTLDMIQQKHNVRTDSVFGKSPVEQILRTVNIASRRSLAQLSYFSEGNQPDAIFGLPETWSPDNVQKFQDYWDNLLSGNWASRRKMKFIPAGSGSRYFETKEPPLKNSFDEYLIRIVCFAFSYPPQAFVALSNRSTAEQHERTAEEEGTEPLKAWVTDLVNDVVEREFSDEVEFAFSEEQEVDPEKQATILNSYVGNGVMSINEAREKLGEAPSDDPAANKLLVKTQTGFVPIGDTKSNNGETK
jgi:hypothetical protein